MIKYLGVHPLHVIRDYERLLEEGCLNSMTLSLCIARLQQLLELHGDVDLDSLLELAIARALQGPAGGARADKLIPSAQSTSTPDYPDLYPRVMPLKPLLKPGHGRDE